MLTHLACVSVYPDTAPELYGAIDGALTRAGSTSADAYPENNVASLAHLVAAGEAVARVGLEPGATAFHAEPVVMLEFVDSALHPAMLGVGLERRATPGDVVNDLAAAGLLALGQAAPVDRRRGRCAVSYEPTDS